MIGKLLKMQMLEDDDELAYTPAETEEAAMKREADGRPGWMKILSSDLLEWSKMLPKVCASDRLCFSLLTQCNPHTH